MDARRTLTPALIHMSLSEVCADNPLKSRSTEAERAALCSFPPCDRDLLWRAARSARTVRRDACFGLLHGAAACVKTLRSGRERMRLWPWAVPGSTAFRRRWSSCMSCSWLQVTRLSVHHAFIQKSPLFGTFICVKVALNKLCHKQWGYCC